ncbi:MAG TPA: hypothetical protein VFU41_03020 [Gemmatimonadales bacterium]|nr:hypothetical protein [Gemmatimonadales bacterium]
MNTKAARVAHGRVFDTRVMPYEMPREPAALAPLLDRLARQLGADRGDAHAVIREAIDRARTHHAPMRRAVVTGLGDFLAAEAAQRAGLQVTHLADALGPAARHAPAAAVALLLSPS